MYYNHPHPQNDIVITRPPVFRSVMTMSFCIRRDSNPCVFYHIRS